MNEKSLSQLTFHLVCGTSLGKSERASTPPASATSSKPSTSKNDLTAEYLRKALSYDHETGVFRWKWREGHRGCLNARQTDKIAGAVNGDGYVLININHRTYKAHRLAWLYIHGFWPINDIDHINGERTDNRIANLREATRQENTHNRKINKNNSTGITGVNWDKQHQKYRVRIKDNHIGLFTTLEAAATARAAAEIKYFGEFRRSE